MGGPIANAAVGFVFLSKNYIFVRTKLNSMKKLVALIVVAGFLTACSQYTCPTYSKKEAPKKSASERRI
jgi:hypothetical protein